MSSAKIHRKAIIGILFFSIYLVDEVYMKNIYLNASNSSHGNIVYNHNDNLTIIVYKNMYMYGYVQAQT